MTPGRRDDAAQERLCRELQPALLAVRRERSDAAVRLALARGARRMPRLVLIVAAATLVVALRVPVPFLLPPLLALGVVLGYAAAAWWHARRAGVRAVDAALACDRAHQSRDRLSAALELAADAPEPARPVHEALAAAAIEDGLAWLPRTDPHRIALGSRTVRIDWQRAAAALLALGLFTWWLPVPGDGAALPGRQGSAAPVAGTSEAAPRDVARAPARSAEAGAQPGKEPPRNEPKPGTSDRHAPPAPDRPEAVPAVPAAAGAGASGSDAAGDSAQSGTPKAAPSGSPGAGRPGGGQGAAAASASEPVPEQKKPQGAAPKPKQKEAPRPTPEQDSRNAESAGAPSGPSRGSGRMAQVANKRSDLERGMEREDDPDVEDEAVEDETNEQEQRGGVMPLRRQDQRPAARELSISGDGPPDQGRGGPTPPKKSRGTASLLLGIRLADQVRGQPNPGTAKTSIEQIPPRRQTADPGLAHSAPAGRAGTPQSARPVQQDTDLLRAYHALLRQREPQPSTPDTPNR